MEVDRERQPGAREQLSERRARTLGSILMAAVHIVAEEGIAGLTMSALAARAGVSRQTLYNYYSDVDGVLAGMVEMGEAGTVELAGRIADANDARAALGLLVTEAVESARSGHPSLAALTAALPAELRGAMQAHEERAEAMVADLLRRGVDEGVFRADLDPELDGRIIHRAAFAGAELALRTDVDPAQLAGHLTADLLRIVEPVNGRRSRR